MKKLEYVWLSKIDISNSNKFKLIKLFGGVENLFQSSFDDLIYFGINDEMAFKILNKNTKEKALYDLEYMNKNNIDIIYFEDKYYPQKLNIIKDKPICFYIKGNKDIINNNAIGIVGSRIALKESLEISRLVANAFSCIGENVISGLAIGIDKFAHLGALDAMRRRKDYWNCCMSD